MQTAGSHPTDALALCTYDLGASVRVLTITRIKGRRRRIDSSESNHRAGDRSREDAEVRHWWVRCCDCYCVDIVSMGAGIVVVLEIVGWRNECGEGEGGRRWIRELERFIVRCGSV